MKEGESKKDKRFLTMAMGVATTSSCRMRHGAVLVRHGKVLSSATNTQRNNPKIVEWNHCSFHAEINALKKVKYVKKSDILYVARVNRFGEERLSKPCDPCFETIRNLGCKVKWTIGHL